MADLSDVDATVTSRPRLAVDAGLIAGLVTVVAWGSAFVGIRAAGHTLSPGSIALGRLLVSCAILVPIALMRREPLPARRDLLQVSAYGVLWLAIYSTTLNAAERTVDPGTAAMLINTGPILIAILAGLFLNEGFPRRLFAGCAIAFAGAVLIGFAGTHSGRSLVLGILLCVAFAPLTGRRSAESWHGRHVALRRTSAGRTEGTRSWLRRRPAR
jgi:drug/metabolite transporter (DMT)-like permease